MNPAEFLSDLVGVDESSVESREASANRIASFTNAYTSQAATSAQAAVTAPSFAGGARGEIIAADGADTEKGFWEQFRILFQRAWKQVSATATEPIHVLEDSLLCPTCLRSAFAFEGRSLPTDDSKRRVLSSVVRCTGCSELTRSKC